MKGVISGDDARRLVEIIYRSYYTIIKPWNLTLGVVVEIEGNYIKKTSEKIDINLKDGQKNLGIISYEVR